MIKRGIGNNNFRRVQLDQGPNRRSTRTMLWMVRHCTETYLTEQAVKTSRLLPDTTGQACIETPEPT